MLWVLRVFGLLCDRHLFSSLFCRAFSQQGLATIDVIWQARDDCIRADGVVLQYIEELYGHVRRSL